MESVLTPNLSELGQVLALEKLTQDLHIPNEEFDDLVAEAKMKEAETVNNGGLRKQLSYLVPFMGAEAVEAAIRELWGCLITVSTEEDLKKLLTPEEFEVEMKEREANLSELAGPEPTDS